MRQQKRQTKVGDGEDYNDDDDGDNNNSNSMQDGSAVQLPILRVYMN